MALPVLRNDLRLYPWQPAPHTGAAQWALHDPLRNRFFMLSADAIEILKRFDIGNADSIVQQVNGHTHRGVTSADVEQLSVFLHQNQLVKAGAPEGVASLLKARGAKQTGVWHRLVHRYLFYRVPLVRPDAFLARTVGWVAPFYARWFLWLTLLAGLVGIALVLRDWHRFEHELRNLWSFSSTLKILLTFIVVKLVHELAHAYTAKRSGVQVPIMGIAFLLLFPVPFTDTSESWKLYHHRQRLLIASAGVVSELIMASWATLLWAVTPAGHLQDALFFVATTTWISSLAINLGPFMRFDGYFVLMDYLQIPNLHKRAGDLARWKLREVLFRPGLPAPERFSPGLTRFLIGFAYVTWIYRFAVFLGIALLVYHFLFKALGVLLFAVEIYYLILRPVLQEMLVWWRMRKELSWNVNSLLAATLLVLAGIAFFTPFARHDAVSGMYEPVSREVLYVAQSGQVVDVGLVRGQRVAQGELVLQMRSHLLESELDLARMTALRISEQVQMGSVAAQDAIAPSGRDSGWRSVMSRVAVVQAQLDDLDMRAPVAGRVVEVMSDVTQGVVLARNAPVAILETGSRREIVLYLTEKQLPAIADGAQLSFILHEDPLRTRVAHVTFIAANPTRNLPVPELAIQHGGTLRSFAEGDALTLDTPVFPVRLDVGAQDMPAHRQRVTVLLDTGRESYARRLSRSVANVLLREFGQ